MIVNNVIAWFEIPVSDFDRAHAFYEAFFDRTIKTQDMGGFKMGMINDTGVSGAICWGEAYTPSSDGSLIYFNANPDIETMLARVEPAGGKILRPKTEIAPNVGFMALFLDTEGNRLALYAHT